MTLFDKITTYNEIGFDVKFDSWMEGFGGGRNAGVRISMRYHGIGGTKIENSELIVKEKFGENIFIDVLDKLYKEMKPHAIGHRAIHLDEHEDQG